jgi:hypothetical protein
MLSQRFGVLDGPQWYRDESDAELDLLVAICLS